FGHRITEKKLQQGNQQNQDEKLPQLDSNVERKQRREQVRPGKLQRLPQRKRKTETVHQPKAKRDHPATLDAAGSNDIFQRHINDGSGDEDFNERGKPQEIRRKVVSRSNQRNGMRHGKRHDYRNQRAQPPERNYQTEEKQEMVRTVEDVEKTQVHKAQRGLMPTRIEAHQTRIAVKFERAHFAARRNESEHGNHAQAQARKPRLNRKTRALRLNRSVEQHVQHRLVPDHIRGIGQRRASDVRERRFVGKEGKIRRKRDARRHHLWIGQKRVVFISLKQSSDPQFRRPGQQGGRSLDIKITRPALRKENVPHRFEWNANQNVQVLALRLHKHLHGHVVRNVVGAHRARQNKKRGGEKQATDAKAVNHERFPLLCEVSRRQNLVRIHAHH